MSHYTVEHLDTRERFERPWIHYNEPSLSKDWSPVVNGQIEAFHRSLPHYGETPLHALSDKASELGFRHIFLKDESARFGLPSFKVLGASWAIHQAICKHIGLPVTTSLADLTAALASEQNVRLVTCTEGNWGRACSRIAKYLGVPIRVYVPSFMSEYTRSLLRDEGAEVIVMDDASYDDTIAAVRRDVAASPGLMVMDTSWEGYQEIPQWVTDGYSTMLREVDRQLEAEAGVSVPDLVFVSVGVGSWAHSVVAHYRAIGPKTKIITVEPEAAPSFKESLHCRELTLVRTGKTIMDGMNCGTTSTIAWPVLRDGVHAAVVVTDAESHQCVEYLKSNGINSGPCGAANLAALQKYCAMDKQLDNRGDMTVVLFSTEGMREYRLAG